MKDNTKCNIAHIISIEIVNLLRNLVYLSYYLGWIDIFTKKL